MAFVENLDQFFSEDDFAVTAVITRGVTAVATVEVIFDEPTAEVGLYDQAAEEQQPRLTCRTSAIATVRRGDTVVVNSKTLKVERLTHGGTGVSTLFLRNP